MVVDSDLGPNRLDISFFRVQARDQLTSREGKLLAELEKAGEGLARVFAVQVNDKYPGANFWPHDVTPLEIDEAASNNPMILNPYTEVKRADNGGLFAVPYHVAYQTELRPVIEHLREASRYADLNQAPYFLSLAHALGYGDHEKPTQEWLALPEEPTIDAVIGFHDRYTDRLTNRKFAAEGWTGILNRHATDRAQQVVDEILGVWLEHGPKPNHMSTPLIRVRVDQTTGFFGQAARYNWVANSLPCQRELREAYGNKFTVFQPNFEDLSQKRVALFDQIYDDSDQMSISSRELLDRAVVYFIAHETSHTLIRRPHDEDRLGASFSPFSELYCTAYGLQLISQLDSLTEEDKDFIMRLHFSTSVAESLAAREGQRREYALGHRVIFNVLLDQGDICEKDGQICWKNTEGPYIGLTRLLEKLEEINSVGTEESFRNFAEPLSSSERINRLVPLQTREFPDW